ncbi:hypothetical protein SAMN05421543_11619 [Alicyclobacillus macrosporangiidus]|uniref:Uncharacterized protein n=1 Tax=Alicyclobacillus macrosporangiidus TaxID=392015 RepID=A0A1I7KHD1_9BACL|nr:hypothetical protein SAMN05421543_11619 [Alicyclobacillus macrosporangiidus]
MFNPALPRGAPRFRQSCGGFASIVSLTSISPAAGPVKREMVPSLRLARADERTGGNTDSQKTVYSNCINLFT